MQACARPLQRDAQLSSASSEAGAEGDQLAVQTRSSDVAGLTYQRCKLDSPSRPAQSGIPHGLSSTERSDIARRSMEYMEC